MKTIVYASLLIALLISPRLRAAAPVVWTEDYAQALVKAKAEKKNLLLNFTGSDWCYFCKILDKDVFASPQFEAWANEHVILVRVDSPKSIEQSAELKKQNAELKKKYMEGRRGGYPTVVITDADGNEIGRRAGYSPGSGADAYLTILKQVALGQSPPYPARAGTVQKAQEGGGGALHEEPVMPASQAFDSRLGANARALNEQGRLPSAAVFAEMLRNPKLVPVALPPVATATLRARDVARRAEAAYVRVGWVYKCAQCTRWHSQLAGGYAIAADTVVTARHVMNPPEKMKENDGFPVVLRGESELLPLTGVLAADTGMDTVVLRVIARDLSGLPLSGAAEVGDPVFCLSDPAGHRGVFTDGIVNRVTVVSGGSKDKVADRRLTVGTDWAPGSSGSAVLDAYGNAVGHVARIQAVFGKKPASATAGGADAAAPVAMNLHEAIPASSVRGLLVPVPAGR
jgi:thioredoxin-related protein